MGEWSRQGKEEPCDDHLQRVPHSAGLNNPLLAGNMAAIFGSALMLVLVSHIFPNKTPFDWNLFKTKITTSDEHVRACILPSISFLCCASLYMIYFILAQSFGQGSDCFHS